MISYCVIEMPVFICNEISYLILYIIPLISIKGKWERESIKKKKQLSKVQQLEEDERNQSPNALVPSKPLAISSQSSFNKCLG